MAGPHPAVAAARSAVRASLDDLAPGALVLVACSGGADSLALAAATAFVAERAVIRVGAVVVDHGMQVGSAAVAARAAQQCRGLGLEPVLVSRVAVGTDGGPEAAARTARYAALTRAADQEGAVAVLLGHTLDDQAETVLLGLARGSGARSLAGMAARRGVLRRPFLGLRRTQTEAVCAALGLEVWHDPSNGDGELAASPRRSVVRARVLPVLCEVLGPGVPEALARSADQLREDADALEELARLLLDSARRAGATQEGGSREASTRPQAHEYEVAVLLGAPAAVRRRALRGAAVAAGSPSGDLSREHVLRVDALLTDWHGQGTVDLPGRVGAARAYGRLALSRTGLLMAPATSDDKER